MKLTAKLIINVVHHGLGVKKIFSSRLPKTALNSVVVFFYLFILLKKHQIFILYQKVFLKKSCVKELCKKSIEKIMWDSAYKQKRIISAFIKALRMKLLPSAGTQFTLRSVSHIEYGTLRKRCCSSRLVFNNLAKLTKILTKKNQCNRFCFISIGVQAVLTFLVCIRNLRQYKKLP